MEETDPDLLVCGQCKRSFELNNIAGFIKHKKFDCEDPGSCTDPKSKTLVCQTCRQKFSTPWALLKHAQNVHFLQIFLEQNYNVQSLTHIPDPSYPTLGNLDSGLPHLPNGHTMQQWIQGIEQEMDHASDHKVKVQQTPSNGASPAYIASKGFDCNHDNFGETVDRSRLAAGDVSRLIGGDVDAVDTSALDSMMSSLVTPQTQSTPAFVAGHMDNTEAPPNRANHIISAPPSLGKILSDLTTHTQDGARSMAASTMVTTTMGLISVPMVTSVPLTTTMPIATNVPFTATVPTASTVPLPTTVVLPTTETLPISVPMATTEPLPTSVPSATSVHIATTTPPSVTSARPPSCRSTSCCPSDACCVVTVRGGSVGVNCCSDQNCGVTVIPGTHEELKNCCNAVVPKKRKQHMETKHKAGHGKRYNSAHKNREVSASDQLPPGSEDEDEDEDDPAMDTEDVTETRGVRGGPVSGYGGKGLNPAEGATSINNPKMASFLSGAGPRLQDPTPADTMTQGLPDDVSRAMMDSLALANHRLEPLQAVQWQDRSANVQGSGLDLDNAPSTSTQGLLDTKAANNNIKKSPMATTDLATVLSDTDSISIDPVTMETVSRQLLSASRGSKKRLYPTSRPYKCDECDQAFNQRIHLKKHQSKHTGIKPFKCDQCDYATVERSHLKVHMRIHTGEKPFQCHLCSYATAQNSTLKIHLRRHHQLSSKGQGQLRATLKGQGRAQKGIAQKGQGHTSQEGQSVDPVTLRGGHGDLGLLSRISEELVAGSKEQLQPDVDLGPTLTLPDANNSVPTLIITPTQDGNLDNTFQSAITMETKPS